MILTIKCFDSTVYRLIFPEFFCSANPKTTKKILSWALRFGWKNKEAIASLKSLMPTLVSESLKVMKVDKASLEAERELALCRAHPDDRPDVKRFYASKLRKMKNYQQTAQEVSDFWESEVKRLGY